MPPLLSFQTSVNYKPRLLSPEDLGHVVSLQRNALHHLPAHQKTFILPKTELQFRARMTSLGQMIGLFSISPQGVLMVAYGCVAFPQPNWPKADMVIGLSKLPCAPESFCALQSDVVGPSFRNMGLHQRTIAVREELCLRAGRTHVLAEVAASNPASLKGFFEQGYHIFHAGHAPDDGRRLLFLHKQFGGPHKPPIKEPDEILDPIGRFDTLSGLLQDGYKAWGMERTDKGVGYKLHLYAPGM